jgi:hypothetical protein
MTVRKMKFRSTLPLLLLAALPAHSVTIQYAGGFGGGAGNFTGVANLFGCSGALMADGVHVITAAHCAASVSVNGLNQTVLTPTISGLSFFTTTNPGGIFDAVTGVHFNPLTALWFPTDPANSLLMYDVAILDLAAPAPADATRYNLDLSGFAIANNSPVVLAGWGLGGFPGGTINGTGGDRRGGTNTVAGVFTSADDSNLPGDPVVALADLPIGLLWTTTSNTSTPGNTLGLGNGGDSGGPLLYNGNLIGVLSFGDLPQSGTLPIGQTYENGYVNLSNPGNVSWLDSLGLGDAPEPGTWMMAAGGALLLFLRRRATR